MNEIEELRAAVRGMQAEVVASKIAVSALIASMENRKLIQLTLTAALEAQLAAGDDGLCRGLSADQLQGVRDAVEWMGTIRSRRTSL